MNLEPERRNREAFAVLTYSNMLTLNALIQVLADKGVVSQAEILDKVKQLERQIQDRQPII